MGTRIRAVMTNGEVWEIDARPISEARARYYANKDCEDDPGVKPEEVYQNELEYALSDDYAVIDWAQNNMNPEELLPHAKRVKEVKSPTFEELWNDCPTLKVVL